MLAQTDRLDRGTVATLRELTDMGHPDFLGELISLFLDTFSGQLTMLFNHAETNDLDGLRRISHDLKSSSDSVGAVMLAAYCAELEALVRSGTTRGTSSLVWHIVEEFRAVRPELEALLPASR